MHPAETRNNKLVTPEWHFFYVDLISAVINETKLIDRWLVLSTQNSHFFQHSSTVLIEIIIYLKMTKKIANKIFIFLILYIKNEARERVIIASFTNGIQNDPIFKWFIQTVIKLYGVHVNSSCISALMLIYIHAACF